MLTKWEGEGADIDMGVYTEMTRFAMGDADRLKQIFGRVLMVRVARRAAFRQADPDRLCCVMSRRLVAAESWGPNHATSTVRNIYLPVIKFGMTGWNRLLLPFAIQQVSNDYTAKAVVKLVGVS